MPFDKDTGAPIHPSLDLMSLTGGRLLPLEHPSWADKPEPEIEPIDENVRTLLPYEISKEKRNLQSQPVSTIGTFALCRSVEDRDGEKIYLGRGCYGRVKLCQHRDGSWYAVKIATLYRHRRDLDRERIRHQKEAFFLHKRGMLKAFYESQSPEKIKFYLVQDWIDGETLSQISLKLVKLPLPQRLNEVSNLMRAITRVHQQGIRHNDLHLANLIRKESGEYVVIDFGRSTLYPLGDFDLFREFEATFHNVAVCQLLPLERAKLEVLMTANYLCEKKEPELTAQNFLLAMNYAFDKLRAPFERRNAQISGTKRPLLQSSQPPQAEGIADRVKQRRRNPENKV